MKARFKTQTKLTEAALLIENYTNLCLYHELRNIQRHFNYKHWGTVTFSKPITDPIQVESVCRRLKKSLTEFYYGRRHYRSELKFLFFIECHATHYKGRLKYHIHFLATEPTNPVRDITSTRYRIMYRSFPEVLKQKLDRIKIVTPSLQKIDASVYIESIYDQESLCDYCLKKLGDLGSEKITIDYLNSDLRFNDEMCEK